MITLAVLVNRNIQRCGDVSELALFGADVQLWLEALDTLQLLDASNVLDNAHHSQHGWQWGKCRAALHR